MQVDFNNLRRLAVTDYNNIIDELMSEFGKEFYSDRMSRLRDSLDELRMKLAFICLAHNENDPEFRDVRDEVKFIEFQDEEN